MIAYDIFLILLVAVPLAIPLIMLCIPSRKGTRAVFEGLHTLDMLFVCAASIVLIVQVVNSGEPISAFMGLFRLDAIACIFTGLIGIMGLLVGVVTLKYTHWDLQRGAITLGHFKSYYIFYQLFVFAMLLAAVADSIILMWVAIEATMLATIFLVSTYNRKRSLEAAWKYLVVASVGVAFGLYGTILVYSDAHAVMDNAPAAMLWSGMLPFADQFDPHLIQIAFVFITIGFGTKAGLFPMLTWVPDADSQAPPPISALLSGVLMAVAMEIVIRFYSLTGLAVGFGFPQMVMLALGILTVAVGAFGLYNQKDLMRKFAYSSCENLGIVALGLGFGGPLGIAVALLHSFFHGFVKCLMFCLCGNVNMVFGHHDLSKIKGIMQAAPLTGVLMAFGLFALAGFPGFALFITEAMTIIAGVAQDYLWVVIIFSLLLSVVVVGLGKVITYNVLRKKDPDQPRKRVSPVILIPEFIMLAMVMWFGFYTPQLVATTAEQGVIEVMQTDDTAVLHEEPLFNYVFHETNPEESVIAE